MDLSVFFAGTGGSIPTAGRGLPALLVRRGRERILFDCGEGTQRQLVRSVGLADLDEIFLTHFHADHWLGLPGLLKTFDLRGRERPLAIHGPPGLRELLVAAMRLAGRVRYRLEVIELASGDVLERNGYKIAPVPAAHRLQAFGYAIYEDERPGEFDPRARVRPRSARRHGKGGRSRAGPRTGSCRAQDRHLRGHRAVGHVSRGGAPS
jgi:ribonuclease Z